MSRKVFSSMELDAIGEIMNISLGSSATAVSNMLDHRVDITTPTVSVVPVSEFSLGELEPAIGVEIKYVSGLEGSNLMLLKRNDVKVIVDILMGTEIPEEEFELNDLTISAVCEVMNQMMGAASTALSNFLGRCVNISTPQSFTLDNLEEFKKEHLQYNSDLLVAVHFMLGIEGMLQSEFVNVMSIDLARELIAGFGMDLSDGRSDEEPEESAASSGGKMSQEEIEKLMGKGGSAPSSEPAPASSGGKMSQEEIEKLMGNMDGSAPAPEAAPASSGGKMSQEEIEKLMGNMGGSAPAPEAAQVSSDGKMSQEGIEKLMGNMLGASPTPPQTTPVMQSPAVDTSGMAYVMPKMMQMMQMMQQQMQQMQLQMQQTAAQQTQAQPETKKIGTKPLQAQNLGSAVQLGKEQEQNLEMIMSVPLEVSVEIGRTKRKVEEILTFSKGSLVVLDKLAGDQVDLFVNGLCVAKGDVVVIDDNFGVRITEVIRQPQLSELTNNYKKS